MFRKINNVFRPNHHGQRGRDGGGGSGCRDEQDYHNACTVRLVRSTSMLVVGEKTQAAAGSTLKRSKSTVSIESTLYYYQRQEDRIWLYSQNQNCLEYLEALVALRRQYMKSVSDLKGTDAKATVSSKKKPAPSPPKKEGPVSLNQAANITWKLISKMFLFSSIILHHRYQEPNPQHPQFQLRTTLCSSLMRSLPAVTANLCASHTRMTGTQTWILLVSLKFQHLI